MNNEVTIHIQNRTSTNAIKYILSQIVPDTNEIPMEEYELVCNTIEKWQSSLARTGESYEYRS